ncbi:branched-chain amino acid ABC transporter permease [Methylobacterium indicum]|uniref:Branched-chain amino acid ABC transporter permease n=1 Tax=Methylobacterium indicum TaxID=1775910 RepID=A0A8H8WNX2_9HYPH|nr:branched-chain amino acid ABC transporter permease [Methylobacterium indicum]BCM81658.1 branched-chain amino acid ABC transporter permease [Methylobacterium indicum]
MDLDIATLLMVDGITTGAVYVLLAIGMVLIFTVTRVIFVPFGDIAVYAALTLSALEAKRAPGTAGLVAVVAVVATLMEVSSLLRHGKARAVPRALLFYLVLPLAVSGIVWAASGTDWPMPVRVVLAIAAVLPLAPLLDRIVFRPVADASVLLLMIISVALHFALAGIGLLCFGAEGVRTQPLTEAALNFGDVLVSGQTALIVVAAASFSLLLFLFFNHTLTGKALHATAVNRLGARLVAIRPERAGTIAYLIGSLLAAISGVLIAPVNTIFYDSGFLLGLFAFVGAIIGGLTNYPGTALGALLVGLLGSYASFFSSSFKEVIVFAVLVPVLLWRSIATTHSEEEIEE